MRETGVELGSRFGREGKKGRAGRIAMFRGGKSAMQEGPRVNRVNKHSIWFTRLIREGKDREIHVGSILKAS